MPLDAVRVGRGKVAPPGAARVQPNLGEYERVRRDFTWDSARGWLAGLPDERGLNIAHEAVDRHAEGPRAGKVAVVCRDRQGRISELTYGQLRSSTSRFANLLRDLGLAPGESVFSLLGRVPELYVTALGTLKHTSVFAPLFPGLGPEPIRQRLLLGDARVLVTTPELYKREVAPIRDRVPGLAHVLLVGNRTAAGDTIDLHAALARADETFEIPPTDPRTPALLHFTSGATGRPKGALHVHEAVVAHHATAAYALDLHESDVFWCTADPGWVTGTSYGIIAPLTHGATLVVDAADFDVHGWYELLQEQRVNVFYTTPTALRMLMRYGVDRARAYDLSALRFIASVGEPLNAEVVLWGQEAFGRPVHDTWWQTETGAIMISNFASMDVRPGSMGRPVPGVKVALLERGEDGRALVIDGEVHEIRSPEAVGEIALRQGWPSMFRSYVGDAEVGVGPAGRSPGGAGTTQRYDACFADGWYLTGDVARRDNDGYYWFLGRTDDVIKSAGQLIGPFEVESVLMSHPAVAEACVIGKPDRVAGEIVKAFVTLRPGCEPSDDLRLDILAFGRRALGALAPKEMAFEAQLPRTRSGKVLRRLLKARELGQPDGDLFIPQPRG
ncbi:acetate--CoA ligase [Actinopolymorpha alba]|uniref:acetate--CoA ligase n=1 Tax=Actinopolymorpha alba TaxID=533267 RepID=UPI00036BEB20|nr:acetate--CoA ligase [Actinopolymorpha alba]